MSQAIAILFVLAVWWLATGVVLGMVWLRRSTFRVSLVLVSVLAVGGLYGLAWSGARATPAGAYVAFGCALAVWSWHELTFLLGVVTGPRKEACPPGARGWERFSMATRTVIHHELALAATVASALGLAAIVIDDLLGSHVFEPPMVDTYAYVAVVIALGGIGPWLAWTGRGRAMAVRCEPGVLRVGEELSIEAGDVTALAVADANAAR